MSKPTSDRRTQRRVPTTLRVEYKFGKTVGKAHTLDLSRGGLFLATNASSPIGEPVYLRIFPKPGAEPLKVVGSVRRVVKAGEAPLPGMGIQFETAYGRDLLMLQEFLDELLGLGAGSKKQISKAGDQKTHKFVFENELNPDDFRSAAHITRGAEKPSPPQARRKPRDVDDAMALRELSFSYAGQRLKYLFYALIIGGTGYLIIKGLSRALELMQNSS